MWKNIEWTNGFYSVNEFGEVKSNPRIASDGRKLAGKPLKPWIQNGGYVVVTFCFNGKKEHHLVHRLVLEAFNPVDNMDKLDVNHIDLNKQNNNLNNLEWCTRSQNIQHYHDNKELAHVVTKPVKKGYNGYFVKTILIRDNNRTEFNTIKEAAQFLNSSPKTLKRHYKNQVPFKGYHIEMSRCND